MKAIIETGGKQYSVDEGSEIFVEKLDGEEGSTVTFDKLVMKNGKFGTPYISGSVTGKIVKQGKKKKIIVFKYNPKKNYHKTQGHRQPYTKVVIESIK